MTTTLKSASVTNDDASPAVANTEGKGAPARLKHVNDFYNSPANDGSTLHVIKLVRIRSNAVVKSVVVEGAALTKGAFDVGLYYSTANDGTQPTLQGTAVDLDFFATAVDFSSAVAKTDVTNERTAAGYPVSARNKPIWEAAGLSTDPGGYFDVAFTLMNTQTVTGLVGCEVTFAG